MKLASLGVVVLLSAPAPVALAQVSGDVSVDVYATAAPGAPVDSVDVFYDQLSPYGVWVDDPDAGQPVFVPDDPSYVPYTNGHWAYTDLGFVWISAEPFAWATAHYGRWYRSDALGRWAWLPDTTWGPSWVDWRETDDGDFGWAPLAPQFVVERGYEPPVQAWHYCPAAHVLDANVARYYEPPQRVQVIHRQARPVGRETNVGRARVVLGPAPERLREHHVDVRPTRVEPRQIGRMSAGELRQAQARAVQRRPQIDEQNRKRLEAHPIKNVQRAAPIGAPAQPPRHEQPPRQEQPVAPLPRHEAPNVAPETHHDRTPREPSPRQEPQTIQPRHEMRAEPPRAQPHPESHARPQAHEPQPHEQGRAAPHPTARPESHGAAEKRREHR